MNAPTDHKLPPESVAGIPPATLQYRRHEPSRNGSRLFSVIAICVLYGLLAVPLFALGVFLLGLALEESQPPRRPQATLTLAFAVPLFFGLGGLLIWWMWRYVRSLHSRG